MRLHFWCSFWRTQSCKLILLLYAISLQLAGQACRARSCSAGVGLINWLAVLLIQRSASGTPELLLGWLINVYSTLMLE